MKKPKDGMLYGTSLLKYYKRKLPFYIDSNKIDAKIKETQ